MIEFSATLNLLNVTPTAFLADEAAQTAARNATAVSMAGVYLDQVTIGNVTDKNPALSHSLRRRKLADELPSIDVEYVITTSEEQLAEYCAECGSNATLSFGYLSSSLSTAVASGAYTSSLQTASSYYGASVTKYTSSNTTVVYSPVTTFVVTAAPTRSPTAGPANDDSSGLLFGLSVAVVAGIGASVVLVLVTIIVWCVYRKQCAAWWAPEPHTVCDIIIERSQTTSVQKAESVLRGESTEDVFTAIGAVHEHTRVSKEVDKATMGDNTL